MYSRDIKLSGIIYLHRITDVRFTGSAHKNLTVFKKLCGDNFYPNVVLATTMWENLGGAGLSTTVGDLREKELLETNEWWGLMVKRGSKTFRHTEDKKRSALSIVDYLISLQRRAVLEIQTQLVDEKRSLQDTSAGMEVERELQQAKDKFAKDLEEVKDELKQAIRDKDMEVAETLREAAEQRSKDMFQAETAQLDLQFSLEQLLAHSETRNDQLMQQLQQQMRQKEQDVRNMERRFDEERRANETKHRQLNEEFSRERRRNEDAQRQQLATFEAHIHRRDAETVSDRRQQAEAFEYMQRRDAAWASNSRQMESTIHGLQGKYAEASVAQRAAYEAHIQRNNVEMVSSRRRAESTISGLQERISDLSFRAISPPSPPLHSPSPSPPRTISNSSDDDEESEQDCTDYPDYDEDWKLEALRERRNAMNEHSLANGGPLLMAVAGAAQIRRDGGFSGTLMLNAMN
ncbi:MAG: hypothetical protein L6R39_004453 [Caloplaca ligustica]|nr:MAG: hypothetical protein L6R39_004453 [Caloplaca ligustica]